MHEIARAIASRDGMADEPALAVAKQLLHLVVADPVVLLVVEHRNEHVQVRQQVAQPARRAERDGEQPARAERRHALVELVAGRFDRHSREARTMPRRNVSPPRQGTAARRASSGSVSRHEVGLPLASTPERGIEPARKHDREQRRRDVRSVVDVLIFERPLAAAATDHADRVDVEQYGRRAAVLSRLRVEDRRVAERKLSRVDVLRMLVQQEPEIGGRPMGRSDGQKHGPGNSGNVTVQYRRKRVIAYSEARVDEVNAADTPATSRLRARHARSW